MTILTTPSRLMKKPFLEADTVNLENGEDQKVVFVERGLAPGSRSTGALLCMSVVALLVASAGFLCGLELYQNYMRTDMMHRYKGFCSIPVDLRDDDTSMVDPQYRVMPLRWSSSPDVQVFSTAEEDTSDDFVKHIREQLDIGDMVEKISVISGPNGRQTSFIHDFSTNISGIVDSDRCFVMELDTHLVMPPSAFVMTIEGGGDFDVSRVREAMRALLPPLADIMSLSPHLAVTCNNKPTYRLQKESITIRKRRALPAAQDQYTHFSGHHVQQIEIHNLAELRAYEEKND